jgi:cbb3-type cytochrome oxidase subunit 3
MLSGGSRIPRATVFVLVLVILFSRKTRRRRDAERVLALLVGGADDEQVER